MHRMGGWFGGKGKQVHPAMSMTALDEIAQTVTYIMADDVDGAEAYLSKGTSEKLSAAEDAAHKHQQHAVGNPSTYQSAIYPPGTEYAVCLAEARLMSAIVGVLNETLTEAIKSFYKLRKAYITLESVMEAERQYINAKSSGSLESSESGAFALSGTPSAAVSSSGLTATTQEKKEALQKANKSPDGEDDDFEFVDADEDHTGVSTPQQYTGHLAGAAEKQAPSPTSPPNDTSNRPSSPEPPVSTSEDIPDIAPLTLAPTISSGVDISLFGTHPVEQFISSGANFCFGILLLIISLVPPAFATLLKIVGFKGDRERGIQMLWQATKYHNIHGAMAGLVLFGFYSTILGFCDILPRHGPGSYPKQRCKALLAEMRQRHPKSHLWLLEEARMMASEKDLEAAVAFMENMGECPLKQLEALQWFERSLNLMYMHEYERTSKSFQKCVTLNNWSHGLYYYICGAAHTEAYRRALAKTPPDAEEAKKQKAKAKAMFDKVIPNVGKKRFMARQLPFDVFVSRKMQKWEARAKSWGVDLVDAAGVSPLEELIYLWNGYKRMGEKHLTTSLENLAWSENGAWNPLWEKEEGRDEKGILALLRAATLRSLGRTSEAKEILQREIIEHDKALFKGHLKDSWTAPCARYEMAACLWREAELMEEEGKKEERVEVLRECKTWLEEVAAWETYDLDARIGMKVTTAKGTLRRNGIEC
ncbi:uncharacterized protein EI97DRAFT_385457 [Westerdykella ornata]|uniref:Inclusion body clearance protein IML2 n=1 Tax=Westerdykella ornata TaxID=318751 RepID=A0A6A6J8N7_WESOR|nr:uncharacterized protein EI97DRAFT_385457 [Westerdykella ornata]KAF2272564.1 hypothetical protein EI97DRAFT_385457 [Westerdykella ornata]